MDAYQDRIGQRLDDPDSVPPQYRHLVPDDLKRVERILSIPVSGRVLDVGTSDGAIIQRIAEKWSVQYVAIDVRPVQVPDWRFHQWDIREPLPHAIGGGLFDAVYACEVFEHLTDADADTALTNILNALKPGGDLIVTVPNRYCNELYVAGCRDRWRWPDHRSVWHDHKLREWLWKYFKSVTFLPLYDGESCYESIWLIVHAKGKR